MNKRSKYFFKKKSRKKRSTKIYLTPSSPIDVLDDFSASNNTQKPHTSTNNNNNNEDTSSTFGLGLPGSQNQNGQNDSEPQFDEAAFIKQLESGMAELMQGAGEEGKNTGGPSTSTDDADLDAFTQTMAQGSMDPNELMKMLMGGSNGNAAGSSNNGNNTNNSTTFTNSNNNNNKTEGDFQEKIRQTMERMQNSGDQATAAASEGGNDDVLLQLLKAMESGGAGGGGGGADGGGSGGAGEDANLDKLFMGIMEQLSNKEMLYEPMKELHEKFGPWLNENRGKLPKEDRERYEEQAGIVADIVAKFDEAGYTDDNPAHRAYIWEKMQKVKFISDMLCQTYSFTDILLFSLPLIQMQAAGSPPDELVTNPLLDEPGLQDALGGDGPQCPQQ